MLPSFFMLRYTKRCTLRVEREKRKRCPCCCCCLHVFSTPFRILRMYTLIRREFQGIFVKQVSRLVGFYIIHRVDEGNKEKRNRLSSPILSWILSFYSLAAAGELYKREKRKTSRGCWAPSCRPFSRLTP